MFKHILNIKLLIIIITLCSCAETVVIYKSEMDVLFEKGFSNYTKIPKENIKNNGICSNFNNATFDQIWESVILIVMQKCVIVESSKKNGVIVCLEPLQVSGPEGDHRERCYVLNSFPHGILIERKGSRQVSVFVNWFENFYRRVDNPDRILVTMDNQNYKKQVADVFFAKLDNEVNGRSKWKHLFR